MFRRFEFSPLLALRIFTLAFLVAGCRSSGGPQLDANTNWLRLCDIDSDCVQSGACICGVCSDTCSSDAQCARGDVNGACVTSRSGARGHRCAQDEALRAEPICLPSCSKDGACDAGFYCEAGGCWPDAARIPPHSLGASRDLSEYDAAVSFDAVTVVPDPELRIRTTDAGAAASSSMIGIWELPSESDGLGIWDSPGVMVPAEPEPLRLEVRYDPDAKGLIGTLSVACTRDECQARDVLARSKPDAVSHDDAYFTQNRLVEGVVYRVFDGRVSDTGFSFWVSNNELWKEWCAVQAPQRVSVDGKPAWACSSGGAPLLSDGVPSFIDTPGRDLLCKIDSGTCSCSETGCRWNPYTAATSFDLKFATDGTLQGAIARPWIEPAQITFTRMSGAKR